MVILDPAFLAGVRIAAIVLRKADLPKAQLPSFNTDGFAHILACRGARRLEIA